MSASVIECVPNVSEGRDPAKITELRAAVSSVSGVSLLHQDSGWDANRTVFTFAGEPEAVLEGAFRLVKCASEIIDMRGHVGTHPRIGAVDVCPVVPISGISFGELLEPVNELGRQIGAQLGLPVYLYERSARQLERRTLPYLRRGQYEGLSQRLRQGTFEPDFGSREFHAKFGAMVLGVRDFLIAFNISLDTKDVAVAKRIAEEVRETAPRGSEALARKFALPGVRAIGWDAPRFDCVQVSANITQPEQAGILTLFRQVERLAERERVRVIGSELVGLIPLRFMLEAAEELEGKLQDEERAIQRICEHLRLSTHSSFVAEERVLEKRLKRSLAAKSR